MYSEVPDKKFIVFGNHRWCETTDSMFWLDNILNKLFNCVIFIYTESYIYANQIKNTQIKDYQTKCRSVFKIRMSFSFSYNLISIDNLLAISAYNFEIFSRSRHVYDFQILRSRLYWLKYKTTSKTETRFWPKYVVCWKHFYDSQNMMEQE